MSDDSARIREQMDAILAELNAGFAVNPTLSVADSRSPIWAHLEVSQGSVVVRREMSPN